MCSQMLSNTFPFNCVEYASLVPDFNSIHKPLILVQGTHSTHVHPHALNESAVWCSRMPGGILDQALC